MLHPERQFNALTPDQEKQNEATKTPEVSTQNEPVAENETSISYLGVTLEKAKNTESQFVPK